MIHKNYINRKRVYLPERKKYISEAERYKKNFIEKVVDKCNKMVLILNKKINNIIYKIKKFGERKFTILLVPHDDKSLKNIYISNYILVLLAVIITITLVISLKAISDNQKATKEVSRLDVQNEIKNNMIEDFKRKIESANKRFNSFKSDMNTIINIIEKGKNIYLYNDFELPENDIKFSENMDSKEINILSSIEKDLEVTKITLKRMGSFISEREKLLKEMPSIYPLANRGRISSKWGHRIDPVYRWLTQKHGGLDITASPGTPVLATADGVVTWARWLGSYGMLVEISHKYGIKTRYAHLRNFAPGIYTGAFVKQGQVVGYVGNTGKSTGFHLHYEIRIGNKTIDPEPFTSMLVNIRE